MHDWPSEDFAALGDDNAIRDILNEICALTGMGFSAVAYVSEDRWIACQVEDRIDFGMDPGDELEIRKTICDEIRRDGTAVVINNTSTEGDWWSHPVPLLYGFKSYVSLPIVLDDGSFFGTLCALDPAPRTERLHDRMDALEALAGRLAVILSNRLTLADVVRSGSGAA